MKMERYLIVSHLFAFLLFIIASTVSISGSSHAPESDGPIISARLKKYLKAPPDRKKFFLVEDENGYIPAVMVFGKELTRRQIIDFENEGVIFRQSVNGIIHFKSRYPVRLKADVIEFIVSKGKFKKMIKRISLPPVMGYVPKLDWTRKDIGAEPSWYHNVENWPLQGDGITVADIDSAMELSHPMFYRADGGYYEWVDVDGDGQLTVDVDGVDFNGDGEISDDETLRLIDVTAWLLYAYRPLYDADGEYTPGFDWLYVDVNGNGMRDFGCGSTSPAFPITESTPAYSEPIFLADDVNRNGIIESHEKLVRLGTSKVKAIFDVGSGTEYRRGDNLCSYPLPADGWSMEHATQALSIVGGGVPGLTNYTGIAPEAELILADIYTNYGDYMTALSWAISHSPDVILHETGTWIDSFLDGSSVEEQTIDDSAADSGIIHINPAGNLGGSSKHAIVDLGAGEQISVSMIVPDMSWYYPLHVAFVTFLWRQTEITPVFEMCNPEDETLCDSFNDTGDSGTRIWNESMFVLSWHEVSSRGTAKLTAIFGDVYYMREVLPVGTWVLKISNPSESNLTIHLYSSDDLYDWTYGIYWDPAYASDLYTVTYPGTADSSLNVAAYAGHGEDWGYPDERGSYRWYSSQGPRIDGVANIDVTAPDNPMTASPPLFSGMQWCGYMEFGGTSGAGPHVAGGVALILQAHPEVRGLAMRERLRETARVDSYVSTPVPNNQWGWGKFTVDGAIWDDALEENLPPTLSLIAPSVVVVGEAVSIEPVADDPDGNNSALLMRWDFDYDGEYDTDWQGVEAVSIEYDTPRNVTVKAQVRDEFGYVGSAIVYFEVVEYVEPGSEIVEVVETVEAAADLFDVVDTAEYIGEVFNEGEEADTGDADTDGIAGNDNLPDGYSSTLVIPMGGCSCNLVHD